MNNIEIKKTNEQKSFISDAVKFLEHLVAFDAESMTESDQELFLNGINEFASSFIYFRESYEHKSSNIRQVGILLEDVREIADIKSNEYSIAQTAEEGNDILMKMVNEIFEKLEIMNECLKNAEMEEQEHNRMEAIEHVFMETKMDIEGSRDVFWKTSEEINKNLSATRDGMETFDKALETFELNIAEMKGYKDSIQVMSDNLEQQFNNWEIQSTKKIEDNYDSLITHINESKEIVLKNRDEALDDINLQWGETIENMEKQTTETLFNMDDLYDKSRSLMFGETLKQIFFYVSSGFSVVNFIILLIMFFAK